MDRLALTTEQQAEVDAFRLENSVQTSDPVVEGTNLVVDDHLEVDNSWKVVVLSGDGGGAVNSYIPEWGGLIIPIDLVDYVTDRAGPNGETMPIYDEQQLAARAAQASGENPREAARAERREERAHRRDVREMLRDGLKRLPHDQRKHAREVLRDKGVLGKDDDREVDQ